MLGSKSFIAHARGHQPRLPATAFNEIDVNNAWEQPRA